MSSARLSPPAQPGASAAQDERGPRSRAGASGSEPRLPVGASILCYDGVCALCSRLVRFLLPRDRGGQLRYAALQSDFARQALAGRLADPVGLSTVVLIQDFGTPGERVIVRSRAILAALRHLSAAWRLLARCLGVLPTPLLDLGYRLVAATRYRVFGRYDTCRIPSPEHRPLFVDDAVVPTRRASSA